MIETPHGKDSRRRRAGVLALQRDARADRGHAARPGRAGHRPAGRRHARLHLHLHDGELHARGGRVTASAWSSATGRIRSAATRSRARRSQQQWTSFVGQFPIPMRHGMTIGELARLFNEAFGLGAALDVVPLEGWRRAMYFDETRPAVGDSLAEHSDAGHRVVYPGAVLFEGTMLSEGRGTTRPFELIGAPWIDGGSTVRCDERARASWRPFPTGGLRTDVSETRARDMRRVSAPRDRSSGFPSGATAVELIEEFRQQNPSRFAWRQPPYEYELEKQPIDILYGNDRSAGHHRQRSGYECARRELEARGRRVPAAAAEPSTCPAGLGDA